jgi:hypothetical protein
LYCLHYGFKVKREQVSLTPPPFTFFNIMNPHSLSGREGDEGGSIGGKRNPASFCGDVAGTFGKGFFPADAAGAHRPELRATNRGSEKVKVGKVSLTH